MGGSFSRLTIFLQSKCNIQAAFSSIPSTYSYNWAVVVAHLIEQSLSMSEDPTSNPVINNFSNHCCLLY